ncbi:MAG: alanine racemase, partial [Clostridia bacterium]|nr:alanine racemase [Clostridia bacterium]
HFSFSFSKKDADVLNQLDKFKKAIKKLRSSGFETGVIHCANSHAFLKHPKTHFDAVRIGSAFLGRVEGAKSFGLKPVGYIESKVLDVNYLKKGENIGYGNTYKTKKDIKTAIVPVGYYNGFATEKSNDTFRLRDILRYILKDLFPKKRYAQINGEKYEIIGRVATLNIIVDITGSDVKPGDVVRLNANPILLDSGTEKIYRGMEL